ncbi:hypothetical protein [Hymenobacter fodinae]|uniref:Uncharacterized protein n=1 Tax=Hymenobacter fodinae TaxID=2510796 RepID=A0A4Z0P3W0_9BACT|nr:hypothetical protein [Hymenobacter fodinae]TGE05585.1 hypothetical protein EU556_19995 [Hymenobacter fodinae]
MTEETYLKAKENRERFELTKRQIKQAKDLTDWTEDESENGFIVIPKRASPAELPVSQTVLIEAMSLYIKEKQKVLSDIQNEFIKI